jgi:single-strand DNA-binding protein
MANLNKVMLIGRLTRDPETRTFASGGKVASFGFAVNNKKKNATTGQWEDEAVFVEIDAFNRGEKGRQLADLVEQYLRKGHQFYIEGHLKFDQWTNREGQKQSKLKLVMDDFQFLEPRQEGAGGMSGSRPAPARQAVSAPPEEMGYEHSEPSEPNLQPLPVGRPDEDIPF